MFRDHVFVAESMFYKWSCRYFSKPLLTGEEGINARRQEREKLALDYIAKCQNSSVSKLQNRITSWDTKFENGTKAALMQPFSPVVIASDENERIRVWNYEEASLLNSFSNHDHPDKGVSKLCIMNEFDEELLLVASSNGNIRIWKDYASLGQQKLVTAFPSIQGLTPGVRSVNAVVDWQPHSGYLFSSGEISPIMAWDLNKEQLVSTIPLSNESSIISALAVSQAQGNEVAAGFADGYVRLYDIRIPKMLVKQTRAHTQRDNRVVGIGFQPGSGPTKIVSASQAGNIQFLDMRQIRSSYLIIDALRGSLTSLAVHRHAPIIACGSAKKLIKVFNLEGDALGTIQYYPTFIAQKTRSVSCLAFHPYRVLLAAGADDARVSIYADEISQPW